MDAYNNPQQYPNVFPLPHTSSSQASPSQIQRATAGVQLPEQIESVDRARAYKSRNKRPCDFCRQKRAACHLENQPPCELCLRHGKECTFVESPVKRRRPNEQRPNDLPGQDIDEMRFTLLGGRHVSGSSLHDSMGIGNADAQVEHMDWDTGAPPYEVSYDSAGNDQLLSGHAFDPAILRSESLRGVRPTAQASAWFLAGNQSRQDAPTANLENESSNLNRLFMRPQVPHTNAGLMFESTLGEPSLERQASSDAQIVGHSGEIDPYLLRRWRYDPYGETTIESVRVRRTDDVPAPPESMSPTFFAIRHHAASLDDQLQQHKFEEELSRRRIDEVVAQDDQHHLAILFHRCVQPYFPVLRTAPGTLTHAPVRPDPCVVAAMYAHALHAYSVDGQPSRLSSAEKLFSIGWQACQPLLYTPNLALVQALLLLAQRRSTIAQVDDTSFRWFMMSTAVGVAQSLGLNRDPTQWSLPHWEIQLRKRLAWILYTQEKWLALTSGRSSHIHFEEDWDVPMLAPIDLIDDENGDAKPSAHGPTTHHPRDFVHFCTLTLIVDKLLHDLFTLKAVKRLHSSIEATVEVAKPIRIRLTDWYQNLPPGVLRKYRGMPSVDALLDKSDSIQNQSSTSHDLKGSPAGGNCSLHLAYITAKIQLFRAMLRPQPTDANWAAFTALRTGAAAVAREVCQFLESLTAADLSCFWASYSSTSFIIASNFLLLLFITSPSRDDAKESLGVLTAWRNTLDAKRKTGNVLDTAFVKFEAVIKSGLDEAMELSPAARQVWVDSGSGMHA